MTAAPSASAPSRSGELALVELAKKTLEEIPPAVAELRSAREDLARSSDAMRALTAELRAGREAAVAAAQGRRAWVRTLFGPDPLDRVVKVVIALALGGGVAQLAVGESTVQVEVQPSRVEPFAPGPP